MVLTRLGRIVCGDSNLVAQPLVEDKKGYKKYLGIGLMGKNSTSSLFLYKPSLEFLNIKLPIYIRHCAAPPCASTPR